MTVAPTASRRPRRRTPLRAVLSAVVTVLLLLVFAVSAVTALRVGYVAYATHDEAALVAEQLRWLEPVTNGDAPQRMQEQFPEGELFQLVLTGLATANDDTRPAAARVAVIRPLLDRADSATVRARFGGVSSPRDGAFAAGWTLLLADALAGLSGLESDRARIRERASDILTALNSSSTGVLESYPGQTWPVDTVVAVAAVVRADRLAGVPGASGGIRQWLGRIEPLRDSFTKLLPHRTDPSGRTVEGPRGTSQSVIQAFWSDIDPGTAARDWVAFENTFLCPRLGLFAVCEYPGGGSGPSDVDTGPLIMGVSTSATAVTIAASRAHGNVDLARDISREAELFGLPLVDDRGRRYLDGRLPIADAFLAWARAVPVAPQQPGVDDRAPVNWPVWLGGAMIPAVLSLAVLAWRWVGRKRHLSGPLEEDAVPPDAPDSPASPANW